MSKRQAHEEPWKPYRGPYCSPGTSQIYRLPPATNTTLGGIKSDSNTISIDINGIASVNTQNLTKVGTTQYGVVKVDGATIKENGSSQLYIPIDTTTLKFDTTNQNIYASTATANTKGVVKPDNSTIQIDINGQLSAVSQAPPINTAGGLTTTNGLSIVTDATTKTTYINTSTNELRVPLASQTYNTGAGQTNTSTTGLITIKPYSVGTGILALPQSNLYFDANNYLDVNAATLLDTIKSLAAASPAIAQVLGDVVLGGVAVGSTALGVLTGAVAGTIIASGQSVINFATTTATTGYYYLSSWTNPLLYVTEGSSSAKLLAIKLAGVGQAGAIGPNGSIGTATATRTAIGGLRWSNSTSTYDSTSGTLDFAAGKGLEIDTSLQQRGFVNVAYDNTTITLNSSNKLQAVATAPPTKYYASIITYVNTSNTDFQKVKLILANHSNWQYTFESQTLNLPCTANKVYRVNWTMSYFVASSTDVPQLGMKITNQAGDDLAFLTNLSLTAPSAQPASMSINTFVKNTNTTGTPTLSFWLNNAANQEQYGSLTIEQID